MEPIFSSERVNVGRQKELDIARGLAVLFMVLIHTQEYFSLPATKATTIGKCIDILGGVPAAPVFMFLLGVGIVFTSKNDWQVFVKRGFVLLLAGYLLNTLRGTLPFLVKWHLDGRASDFFLGVSHFAMVDIFQFSGLILIMFGCIKKFAPGNLAPAFLMLTLPAVNILFSGHFSLNLPAAAVSGLFWGSSKLTVFPFLSWAFYPLAGFLWGNLLIRCTNKSVFYALNALAGAGSIAFLYWLLFDVLHFLSPLGSDYAYYHHALETNLLFTAAVLVWISILYFVSLVLPDRIFAHIERWSRNVSEIYFIHWVLIGWLVILISAKLLPGLYFVLFFLVFIVSDCLADYVILRKKVAAADTAAAGASVAKTINDSWKIVAGFVLVTLSVAILDTVSAGELPVFAAQAALKKGARVFVYDDKDRRGYPARVKEMAGIDRCLVEYDDGELKPEVVDDSIFLTGDLPAGTPVLVYDDDEKLVDAIIVAKMGEEYSVTIGRKNETVKIADLLLPESYFLK